MSRPADSQQRKNAFAAQKAVIVAQLEAASASGCPDHPADRSNKGSVDTLCWPLIRVLNGHPDYVTTSSCSGRLALFYRGEDPESDELVASVKPHCSAETEQDAACGAASAAPSAPAKGGKSRGGGWLLSSHEPVSADQLRAALQPPPEGCAVLPQHSVVWLMFEPFVLHVLCRS
eukprot:RCo035238